MVESEDVKKAEIDRLYKENVSKVYRTALYYVEDHYVAEEIVQEVFLKLYDNLGDICMESVSAWLITTAKNMAKNYLRDSKWETPMEEVPEQEVPYSSEGLDAQLIEVLRRTVSPTGWQIKTGAGYDTCFLLSDICVRIR